MSDISNPEKPTDQWVTGDEPLTGPQDSYLHTLAREAGEEVPEGLTKAQASEMIDRLQHTTGRGEPDDAGDTDGIPQASIAAQQEADPPSGDQSADGG